MTCIFCRIVAKEIPNYTVYEDSHALAFLDIQPLAQGHTVIIPKVHAGTLLDLPDSEAAAWSLAVKRALERVDQIIHPDGFNVGLNHGEAAGQAVAHLHMHIIPRFRADGGGSMHSIIEAPSHLPVQEVAKLFA